MPVQRLMKRLIFWKKDWDDVAHGNGQLAALARGWIYGFLTGQSMHKHIVWKAGD
jgi:hypothetical protein